MDVCSSAFVSGGFVAPELWNLTFEFVIIRAHLLVAGVPVRRFAESTTADIEAPKSASSEGFFYYESPYLCGPKTFN